MTALTFPATMPAAMALFALGAVLLAALAGWLVWPGRRRVAATGTAPAHARPSHLGILSEQLAALDRERADGLIDADQHRRSRHELQRRVLDESALDDSPTVDAGGRQADSRKAALGVGLAVPLFAIALYAAIGNPAALTAVPADTTAAAPNEDVSPAAVQAMLETLAKRLETPSANPENDLQGWTMLARSYAALQRFADADNAFMRALALAPDDAALLADRADVLVALQGASAAVEADRLIAKALRIDPRNLKALTLAGNAAFERKDFGAARGYWERARALAPAGGEFAAGLDRSLAAAREAGGEGAAAAAVDSSVATAATAAVSPAKTSSATVTADNTAPATTGSPGAMTPASITGRVSLSPALAAKVAPTDTVFVFARAAEGSRMPLAIIRRTVADLPFNFTLDDSLAMSPETKLSGASRVIVAARISRSGNAMPQAGDLYVETETIDATAGAVRLLVERARP